MLNRFLLFCLVLLSCLFLSSPCFALPPGTIANPQSLGQGWVADTANLLSPDAETQINQLIDQFHDQKDDRIFIVTVPAVSPDQSPRQLAETLFEQWDVDQAGEKLGVLILLDSTDRRIEIKTGMRSTSLLPNWKVKQLIDFKLIPRFRQGRFDQALLTATRTITAALHPRSLPPSLKELLAIGGMGIIAGVLFLSGFWQSQHQPAFPAMSDEEVREYALYYRQHRLGQGDSGGGDAGGYGGDGSGGGGDCGGGDGGSW